MYDEDATYDTRLQERALRLVIARCPGQAAAAADALRSRSDAGRQARLDRIIPIALRDEGAWDDQDREVLARALSGPDDDALPEVDERLDRLGLGGHGELTTDEWGRLLELAETGAALRHMGDTIKQAGLPL